MQHILLLHGAIGAKDQFDLLAKMLNERFIIYTMNFSGHGDSSMPDEFSIERFADDVADYLSANNIESTNIFGFSMGGYVALYLARNFPARVKKVFTLATKFSWTPEIAAKEIKLLDANIIANKIPAFAHQLEKRHQPNDWKEVLKKTADMMISLGKKCPLNDDDFKSIENQILIGIGDNDMMVTLEETISVFKKLPNANLVVFPKTQHPIEKIDLQRLASEIDWFFNPQQ